MITVCLNKAEFEYDIHSLVKAFFAGEEVKVFADSEKISRLEQEQTPLFHMEIVYEEGTEPGSSEGMVKISLYLPPAETEIPSGEKPGLAYEAGGYRPGAAKQVETDFSDRKSVV